VITSRYYFFPLWTDWHLLC